MSHLRRAIVAVLAVAMTLAATSLPAAAAPSIRTKVLDTRPNPSVYLRGSGWGHSVGMSQYGAYQQAREGRAYRTIFKHYYPGVGISQGSMPAGIRVGLHNAMTMSNVKAIGGPVRWALCGSGGCRTLDRRQRGGTTWTVRVLSDGRYKISRGDTVLYKRGAGKRLRANFNPHASSDGTAVEAFNPNGARQVYKWGHLEYSLKSASAQSMFMVLSIPSIELYLRGLGEMPSSWGANRGMAALKTQATAGRTYALRLHRAYNGNRSDCRCSLLATPANQAYTGYGKETESYGRYWVNAVNATASQVATYGGSLIATYYSSSHGGRSENSQDSWAFSSAVPYLRSVADPWSLTAPNNSFANWARSVRNRTFARFVGGLRKVRTVRISGRTDGGTPRSLVVSGVNSDGNAVTRTRTGTNKGIVGIDLRNRFDYPARGLSSLPTQQIRKVGFAPYLDDDGSRYEYAIVFVHRAGIMRGTSSNRFNPRGYVSRGAMAEYLYRTFSVPAAPDGKDYYNDDDGNPAEPEINALAHAGVFGGQAFKPGDPLLRGALQTYLGRLGAAAIPRDYFTDKSSWKVRRANMADVLWRVVERYR